MKNKIFWIFIFGLILILAGFGCREKEKTEEETNQKEVKIEEKEVDKLETEDEAVIEEEQEKKEATDRETEVLSNWKTYKNDELGFEFSYPEYLEVKVDILNKEDLSETLNPDNPWLPTRQTFENEKAELANSEIGTDFSISGNETVRAYFKRIIELAGGQKAMRYLGTEEGGGIVLRYSWFKDDFKISVWVAKELPESVYKDGVADNLAFNALLAEIEEKGAEPELQNYFEDFEKSLKTLKFKQD